MAIRCMPKRTGRVKREVKEQQVGVTSPIELALLRHDMRAAAGTVIQVRLCCAGPPSHILTLTWL